MKIAAGIARPGSFFQPGYYFVTVQRGSKSCEKVCYKLVFVAQHAKNAPGGAFFSWNSPISERENKNFYT